MARTPQTARKSTSGKAPRKTLQDIGEVKYLLTCDHKGDKVHLVWHSKPWRDEEEDQKAAKLPPFPFQVYVTSHATATIQTLGQESGGFAHAFATWHFEVYSKPQANIVSCIEHQKQEREHRRGTWPHMVERWGGTDDGHEGFIIVIDIDTWKTDGFAFVEFEPRPSPSPDKLSFWCSVETDDCQMRAYRIRDLSQIGGPTGELKQWWSNAGHEWEEARLSGLNDNGVEPTWDFGEDEDAGNQETDTTADQRDTQYDATLEDDKFSFDEPRFIDSFDQAALWKTNHDLKDADLLMKCFTDSSRRPVTAVWDKRHGSAPPRYSHCLYLSFDCPPLSAKAIFTCLSTGLLKEVAWNLQIIREIPSLGDSLQHYRKEALLRSMSRTTARQQYAKLVVERIAGHRLPSELNASIEDALVPPPMQGHSGFPHQLFQSIFMYLDASKLSSGPLILFADPVPYNSYGFDPRDGDQSAGDMSWHPSIQQREEVLRVIHLRFWHRVTDMFHNIWTLCSDRDHSVQARNVEVPVISLEVDIAVDCVWEGREEPTAAVRLASHATAPLTLQTNKLFSCKLWDNGIVVIDAEVGDSLRGSPFTTVESIHNFDTWSATPELAIFPPGETFVGCLSRGWLRYMTLLPGETQHVNAYGSDCPYWWWLEMHRRRLLQSGKEYIMQLKPGVSIPRWTWGTAENLHRPYDLPPLPLVMAKEVRFCYRKIER